MVSSISGSQPPAPSARQQALEGQIQKQVEERQAREATQARRQAEAQQLEERTEERRQAANERSQRTIDLFV